MTTKAWYFLGFSDNFEQDELVVVKKNFHDEFLKKQAMLINYV